MKLDKQIKILLESFEFDEDVDNDFYDASNNFDNYAEIERALSDFMYGGWLCHSVPYSTLLHNRKNVTFEEYKDNIKRNLDLLQLKDYCLAYRKDPSACKKLKNELKDAFCNKKDGLLIISHYDMGFYSDVQDKTINLIVRRNKNNGKITTVFYNLPLKNEVILNTYIDNNFESIYIIPKQIIQKIVEPAMNATD